MSILFCTPCYGGLITAAHFQSCMELKDQLNFQNVPHDWRIGWNESLVTRARNEMTADFLKTDHSHMMWLDADISFTADDVGKLWNLNVDIAVAFYCMKLPNKPLSAWLDGKLINLDECPKQPFPVDYAGTGFMMIKRRVIEIMAEASESYEGPNGRVPALYMTPVYNDGFESEDYHFCRRAREQGFRIIGDPSIKLGHWGQARYGLA
jgi:hypothetical protein